MDGKLTKQSLNMVKMEQRLEELENMMKEKGKSIAEPAAKDTSATSSPAPAEEAAEGLAFQVESFTGPVPQDKDVEPMIDPEVELEKEKESDKGTEVLGSLDDTPPPIQDPQLEPQPFPPYSEKVSIMGLFHQMVHEEQAKKEAAKVKTQQATSVPVQTTEKQIRKEKEKTTTAPQVKSKPPSKGIKKMATKTNFLKRRKSSKSVEKARPSTISSPQEPLEVSDKSSPEPSPQKSPPEPSPEPLNVKYFTDESSPSSS
ncbi:PREDICTED: pollen-specific leucine-rich repeat extensin-like protein 1 [Theobroma cacao]|uniref:Pollen-specific leucine-rich repeat extensin-like protein 1 n=1 Tax=Theobroma cacao TaxID=3641 RepID=A0AB32WPE1_THECC|nr:PREDICTED: pollen-specific leucine-rich repeat extensin-like protein 1 [Theobroma cacao]